MTDITPRPTDTARSAARSRDEQMHRLARSLVDEPASVWRVLRDLPGVRSWKILNDIVFLVTSGIVGIVWFVFAVAGVSVGGALLVVLIGLPIIWATVMAMVWGADLERARIRTFLGIDIPSPHAAAPREGNLVRRSWRQMRSGAVWRDVAYLLLLFPLGLLELVIGFLPIQLVFGPLLALFGIENGFLLGSAIGPVAIIPLIVGLLLLIPLSIVINLLALLHGEIARRMLSPSTEAALTERVEVLTESRSAVMRAMYLERRRIERDLHDGAQQRLVALAMDLGRARERIDAGDDAAARQLVVRSHEESKVVLRELRDLIRGIHPAVLSDRGLDAAISAIAGRSPIPVGVEVDLPTRQPEEVEGTAYFVVVEALTNIARHSHATRADVAIARDGAWLRVEISDNGLGGANPASGSGLSGLRDRIEALDGRLRIESPDGGGTRLVVEIPCGT